MEVHAPHFPFSTRPCQCSHPTLPTAPAPAPLVPSATSPRIHHLSLDRKPPKIYLTSATTQRRATLALPSSLLLPFVFIPNNTRSSHCQQPQISPPPKPKASRALSYPFPPPPIETEFNFKPVKKKQRSNNTCKQLDPAAPSSQVTSTSSQLTNTTQTNKITSPVNQTTDQPTNMSAQENKTTDAAVNDVTAALSNTNITEKPTDASAPSPADGCRLYIGNLAYATTEEGLKEFFQGYLV